MKVLQIDPKLSFDSSGNHYFLTNSKDHCFVSIFVRNSGNSNLEQKNNNIRLIFKIQNQGNFVEKPIKVWEQPAQLN